MFSLCPKNSSLYTTHGGFGNGSQVRRFVNQSLRVPCEWMQRRMDAAGILTFRAEKAVLCPHPVFSYSGVFHLYGKTREFVKSVRNAGKPFTHKTG
jgi:hypothetical protein